MIDKREEVTSIADKWWLFHPIIAPLPQGFLDGDTSRKEAKEWMGRATTKIEELNAENARLREALTRCGELFSEIRSDWSDPRAAPTQAKAFEQP